jgi:hypothetical protein
MAQQSGFDGGGICARNGKVMATIEAQRSAPKEREIHRLTTKTIRLFIIRRKSYT